MKLIKLTNYFEKAEIFARKQSPAILAGLAVVGLAITVVSAYKAGSKADKILEEKRKDMKDIKRGDKKARNAVIKETVVELTPILAPTIMMGAVTAGCIIGSHSVSSRRIAALSAAYTVSETAVKSLTTKMEEVIGEKKTLAIKDAIAQDKLNSVGVIPENNVYVTGDGNVLCKDSYSGRPFYSNAQKIEQAIMEISSDVASDMYASLNDFYDLIHLDRIPMGEDLGWNADSLVRGKIPVTISALLTEDKRPCLCVEYYVNPRVDYRNFH